MENGTLCHFYHFGDSDIKVGKIVEQPTPSVGKVWGGYVSPVRYGVEFDSPQFGKLKAYVTPENIIPYQAQEVK
jgi:hypothetical protein